MRRTQRSVFGMELSERKKKILAAVVDAYINTAEPVGSKHIAEHAGLNVSSATIRGSRRRRATGSTSTSSCSSTA